MRLFKIIIISFIIHSLPYSSCYAIDQIFEEKRAVITKAFRIAFSVPLPDQFQPLIGGFSSPGIYKVMISEKPYVLRLSHPKRTLKDEQRTIACMKLSAAMKISPKIYYTSAEDGIVIMDYVEPKLLSWEELTSNNNLKKLALMLKKLHSGPKFPEFVTVFDVRRMFERILGDHKLEFLEELSNSLNQIEATLKDYKIDNHPCHNDLKLDNILFDGEQFWLVDWEAASQDNFLFDIATVITFLAMTAEQEKYFLETYFAKEPAVSLLFQLELMKQVVLIYYGTAYLMVAKIRYHLPVPTLQNISALPDGELFLRSHISNSSSTITPENIQEFGMVLLSQALKNIRASGR